MINFCITNSDHIKKDNFENKISLGNNNVLYHDSMVEIKDLSKHLIAFCGILWEGQIEDFTESDQQNGQFYAMVFDKQSNIVKVISDFLEDFPVYYYIQDGKFAITNSLLAFSKSLDIDEKWFGLAQSGNYTDRLIQPYDGIATDKYLTNNITPIKDVKRLGPGRAIEIQLGSGKMNTYSWYDAGSDYVAPIFAEPIYNTESAKDLVDKVLKQNAETLKEKYGSLLAMFASNGVDSLTLIKYLEGVPKYGYYGKDYMNESPELLKRLYENTGGTLHYFDEDQYRLAYSETIRGWKTPSFNMDLAPEMHIRNRYNLKDKVLVKGTFGDEIFWHDARSAMSVAVHDWRIIGMKEIVDSLKENYSRQLFHMTQHNLDKITQSQNLEMSIMNYHYNRQKSYLKDDRVLLDQMIISPFIDLRLRGLLPRCDRQTRTASILDASIQTELIGKDLVCYMNKHKAGGEESFGRIGYAKQQRKQLEEFIKSR